jgi:hypothetical protein
MVDETGIVTEYRFHVPPEDGLPDRDGLIFKTFFRSCIDMHTLAGPPSGQRALS